MTFRSRRQFLHMLGRAAAAAAAASAVAPVAAQRAGSALAATPLRDGMLAIGGAGGNVVAMPGPDGAVVVDSGTPDSAPELAGFLRDRFGDTPVAALFNTHWHLDHTGGNEALAAADTRIVAHENTRLWMSTKVYVEWEDRRYEPRPDAALPNDTFFSSDPQPIELEVGGERIVYGHLREAHTDGDIYVRFPQRNVIAAGGTATTGRYPVPDYITGGWIGGLGDATRMLIEMSDADTLIVPAWGPVLARSDLEAQLEMLATVRERIEAMALVGRGIDEMIEARLTAEFDERFGDDAALFVANVYHGLWWGGRMRGIVAQAQEVAIGRVRPGVSPKATIRAFRGRRPPGRSTAFFV